MISDRLIIHEGRTIGFVSPSTRSGHFKGEDYAFFAWRATAPNGESVKAFDYDTATAWLIQRDAEQKMEQR